MPRPPGSSCGWGRPKSSESISKKLTSASPRPIREEECGRGHAYAEHNEDETETKCETEVSLARFQCNGRRHGSGITADIASDDDDRADFGNGAAERDEKGRQQRATSDLE
jgi:hypothetical protein